MRYLLLTLLPTLVASAIGWSPFWTGGAVDLEPMVFIKKKGSAPPCAALLFLPTKLPRLVNFEGDLTFLPEIDYT